MIARTWKTMSPTSAAKPDGEQRDRPTGRGAIQRQQVVDREYPDVSAQRP